MSDCHKASQFPYPTAITRGPKNVLVGRFQIAFGFETHRSQGTVTCRASKEEHVREFSGSHYRPSNSGFGGAEPITRSYSVREINE